MEGTISILRNTFSGYKRQLIILVFLGLASGLLEGVGIGAIVPLLSFLISGTEGDGNVITSSLEALFNFIGVPFKFSSVIVLIFILFLIRSVVLALSTYIRASITASFMNKEMGELISSTMHAKWEYLLRQKAGHVQTTMIRSVQKTMDLLGTLAQSIQSFTGLAMYIAVAMSISWKITSLTLLLGALVFFFSKPFVKRIRKIGNQTLRHEKSAANHILEDLSGMKTIKASGKMEFVIKKIRADVESLRGVIVKGAIVRSLGAFFVQPVGFLFVLLIFASTYKTGGFSLAIFAATVYLIQKIFIYIDSGQKSIYSINEFAPYAGNIIQYKKESQKATEHFSEAIQPFVFKKAIRLKDVSLSYEGRGEALSKLNSTVQKGDMVGIVGPSGSGKTSLVDLLLRLFTPTEGAIYIDGQELKNISLKEWRENIGYVSQDLFLLNDTVENNIRFYDPTLSKEQIQSAAKQTHIHDVIEKLPEGYQTNTGDRGVMLSAGQRQRIVLARILARKPEIIILDEATSALDTESEGFIKQAIKELRGETTIFIVAHRLTTVMDVDNLLVIDGGKIIESGSPKKLLENKRSYFYRLVHLQGDTQ